MRKHVDREGALERCQVPRSSRRGARGRPAVASGECFATAGMPGAPLEAAGSLFLAPPPTTLSAGEGPVTIPPPAGAAGAPAELCFLLLLADSAASSSARLRFSSAFSANAFSSKAVG